MVSIFTKEAQKLYGSTLREVILYGSCARGDYAPDSDIDILILLDVPQEKVNAEWKRIVDITDRLDLDYDVVLAPVFQSQHTFEQYLPVSRFYQNVRDEGVRYA